jgi:hypothetical protein
MFGEQLQQTFTALVIDHLRLLLFSLLQSSPRCLPRIRSQVVALLTLETNHFTNGSQSSFAQQLDYFPRREGATGSSNQRFDYLILSHHVDCFRIDTAARPDFY